MDIVMGFLIVALLFRHFQLEKLLEIR
jgi:hypothetical protein